MGNPDIQYKETLSYFILAITLVSAIDYCLDFIPCLKPTIQTEKTDMEYTLGNWRDLVSDTHKSKQFKNFSSFLFLVADLYL